MDSTITEETRGELTPEELERAVSGLIEAYRRLRGLDSLLYRAQPKHTKMWRLLARELHACGVPLRRYIYWAYMKYRSKGPYVFVNQITSLRVVHWYSKEAPNYDRDIQVLIRLQWETLKAALDEGMTPREIIHDSTLDLGVVFKYSLACHMHLSELAESMRADAESELYFEPGYKKYLADFLPTAE